MNVRKIRLWLAWGALAAAFVWAGVGAEAFARFQAPDSEAATAKPRLVVQLGHANYVGAIVWSRDGRFVATASFDGTARLWDPRSGAELQRFDHPAPVSSVAFVSARLALVTGCADGETRIWNLLTGKETARFKSPREVYSVASSPDGGLIASGGRDGITRLWDAATGRETRSFGTEAQVLALAFSSDGKLLLTGHNDNVARLWNVSSGKVLRTFTGHTNAVGTVALAPDATFAVTGSTDRSARIWNIATGEQVRQLAGHEGKVSSVEVSADGKHVLTGGADATIRVWDAARGEAVRAIKGHRLEVTCLAAAPDGIRFASASADWTARTWNLATGDAGVSFAGTASPALTAAYAPDGTTAVVAGVDGVPRVWDFASGVQSRRLEGHAGPVWSARYASDGARLVTGGSDGTARLWDTVSGRQLSVFGANETKSTESADLSADGRFVLTCGGDNTVVLWDVATGAEARRIGGGDSRIICAAISPDGTRVLTGDADSTVGLWDRSTGERIHTLTGHGFKIRSVAFSPDGKLAVSGADDNTARVWDLATGALAGVLTGHAGPIQTARFSRDGRFVFTGSWDNSVRLWDLASGNALRVFEGHTGRVSSLDVSPDGARLLTGSYDATARLWDVASGAELCRLTSFAGGSWMVADPAGRFDAPDLEALTGMHWIMPDDPFTPLQPEVFMRDYYEPRLLARIVAGERLTPVRPLSEVNRAQPVVKILSVEQLADDSSTARVRVEVTGVLTGYERNGRKVERESGAFDLRLFRDGQLVAHAPDGGGALALDPVTRKAVVSFDRVRLPKSGTTDTVEFAAYAFNSDRVKSVTDRKTLAIGRATVAGERRAYVVSIGVNAYDDPGLNLRFAVNDARRMQDILVTRLRASGVFDEVIEVALLSDVPSGGRGSEAGPATKANIRILLDLLAGRGVAPDALRAIPGAARIRPAGPDDLLVLTVSSHGYAAEGGAFYLLPSDVGANARDRIAAIADSRGLVLAASDLGEGSGILERFISSDELAGWLRDVDAGETVLVVDACQSAASVQGDGFKPGPMGSRGLGQLAFDKGMRILAATQADNVALELKSLAHGLVSYVLLREGLDDGRADFRPKDNTIWLSEWLAFAVERVPVLYQEIRQGTLRPVSSGQAKLAGEEGKASPDRLPVQRPSLFNFSKRRVEIPIVPALTPRP